VLSYLTDIEILVLIQRFLDNLEDSLRPRPAHCHYLPYKPLSIHVHARLPAVGTVKYRSMTEPIRVTNPYIDNFLKGRAIGVDVQRRVVQVQLMIVLMVMGACKGIAANISC